MQHSVDRTRQQEGELPLGGASFVPTSNRRWLTSEMGGEFSADLSKAFRMLESAGLLVGLYGTSRDHALLPEVERAIAAVMSKAARCPDVGFLTGGGPGSMRVATTIANTVARSFAIKAGELCGERVDQDYSGVMVANHMMWTRRFLLTTLPAAVIGTPGGVGTVHEIVEHAFLQGRGLIERCPVVCLDTPGGYFAALRNFIADKVLPYESGAMQHLFPRLWRVSEAGDLDSAKREGERIAAEIGAITSNTGIGAPHPIRPHSVTPNARWFTPEVVHETQRDLNHALGVFNGTGAPDLSGASFIALLGDLTRYGDHAAAVLRNLARPNVVLLTDDRRGREIADLAGIPSLTLVNDHDGNGYLPGISVDGNHVRAGISHLVCAKRFILTTSPSAVIAYPGDLHTLDKMMEFTVLHQVGLLNSQAIVAIDSGDYWKELLGYAKTHLLEGGYINRGDMDLLRRVELQGAGSAQNAAGIIQGASSLQRA